MKTPLRLSCRHFDLSPSLEARVREHAAHLEGFHDQVTGCHVFIEAPAQWRSGGIYTVTIELDIPGGVIHTATERRTRSDHSDVYAALRDAFDNATRQLQEFDHAV